MTTLINTYEPERDALDFDRPVIITEHGPESLHAPNLRGVMPLFAIQALGYATPAVSEPRRYVGILHAQAGITVFDGNIRVESEAREPEFSRRRAVLDAIVDTPPMSEAVRGHELGDGEIPNDRCDVICVDTSNGDVWLLPHAKAASLMLDCNSTGVVDGTTESQAVDVFYAWLSGELG